MTKHSLVGLSLLLLGGVIGLSACDSNMGGVQEESVVASAKTGKLRHGALLPEIGSGKTGADSVTLVIGNDPVYEQERIFRRYRIFRSYRIFRRYELGDAVDGEVITVGPEELQALLDSLENDPSVAWIEPDFDVSFDDMMAGTWVEKDQKKSWGIGESKADGSYYKAGDKKDEKGVPDVDLYVFDGGVENPDINVVECLEMKADAFQPCVSLRDFDGHGTAVAGIAAAMDNNVGLVGTAPGAPVRVMRTLNAAGFASESRIVKALDFVIERKKANPARPIVVNLSLGAYIGSLEFTALDEAVQAAIDAGITVVVSAGNDGALASLYSPAHVLGAITVGAYNKDKKLSDFSNRGLFVDLLAPGENLEMLFSGAEAGRMLRDSGTSYAAPHVAGAAAVVLAAHPTWTPQQVRDYLVSKARDVSSVWGTTRKALNMDKMGEPSKGGHDDDDD